MRNAHSALYSAVLAGILAIGIGSAAQAAMSEAQYDAAVKAADARLKTDKERCSTMSGNAEDVCKAQAEAEHTRVTEQAKAEMKGTSKARLEAAEEVAEANYKVAKERCDDFSGDPKDICLKEAKATYEKQKADITVLEKGNTADARKDAMKTKTEADYEVAKAKCDQFSGDTKDACVKSAKDAHNIK